MRRAQAGSNADAHVRGTWPRASSASRVLPPDSARERREQVAAPASVEQHEDDRARQDALRDLEIRVDVDDRGKLDSERDRGGRVRGQRLTRVVHELRSEERRVGKGWRSRAAEGWGVKKVR